MNIAAVIGAFIDGMPIVRIAWRWLWERNMEVSVSGYVWRDGDKDELKYIVAIEEPPEGEPRWRPHIYTLFSLCLVNHRTDRKERIIGAWFAIKKRRLYFWRKTLIRVPVHHAGPSQLHGAPISNIELEPQSAPMEIGCIVDEALSEELRKTLPVLSEIWLDLQMVGPLRHVERKLQLLRRGDNVSMWHRIGL